MSHRRYDSWTKKLLDGRVVEFVYGTLFQSGGKTKSWITYAIFRTFEEELGLVGTREGLRKALERRSHGANQSGRSSKAQPGDPDRRGEDSGPPGRGGRQHGGRDAERVAGCGSGPSLPSRALRTQRGPEGHAGWFLPATTAYPGRGRDAEGAKAAHVAVRDGHHRALPAEGKLGGRSSGGDVSRRGERAAGGRHHRSPVGHAGEPEHGKRAEPEDLRTDRGLAQQAARGPLSVRIPRWAMAEAKLGRRGAECVAAGGDRRECGRLSRSAGSGGRGQGRPGQLDGFSTALERARAGWCSTVRFR